MINGFILKSTRKNGEHSLDWASSFEENKTMKAADADMSSYCGVDSNMNIYRKWLHMIWCELLCSELGYCKISLDMVIIHVHQFNLLLMLLLFTTRVLSLSRFIQSLREGTS